MAKVQVVRGTTSYIARVFVQDTSKTDGSGLTGLVFNSSSLTAYYIRQGDATATPIALVTAAVGTFTSSGFKEVDATNLPGVFELGIPNAALSSGVSVLVMLKGATNMAPVLLEIELDSWNNQDAVRGGLTALPNAAAGANGGLPTGDASGRVTVGTNADKTGYALTTAEHTAISGTDVPAGLVTGHLTTARADKLDDLDATISSRMATFTDPTTALTEIAADTDMLIINVALQATASALSTAQTAITEIATDTDTIITTQGAQATSSALATAQTALTEIAVDTDSLLTGQALQATASALSTAQTALNAIASGLSSVLSGQALQATSAALATAQTAITAIKTATDQFRFTIAHEVDANALTGGGGTLTAAQIWDYLNSNITTPASIGYFVLQKLGLIGSTPIVVPPMVLPPATVLTLIRGDAITLSFACVSTSGDAYDLAGANLIFLVKRNPGDLDTAAKITKTQAASQITITDAAAGECSIPLTGADTTGKVTGTYYWGIKDLTQDKTVARGTIILITEPVQELI